MSGLADDRLPLLGADGPSVLVDVRSAYLLRDALRAWVAHHRRAGAMRKVAAVAPVLEAWEIAADAHAARVVALPTSADGRADAPASAPRAESSVRVTGVAEAAALLGVSERQVRRLAATEGLPGRRIAGSWVFELADVRALLAQRRSSA